MTSLLEPPVTAAPPKVGRLVDQFEKGLDAPICLTWELTYACNLSCVHCLSSSGKRDPRELSTEQCKSIIDELQRMQVFYVNIGGGEPTVRSDFWELVDYATAHQVGVKFSTNGVKIDKKVAARLAASDYVDVQISLDGATAEVNDAVRGPGSFAMAVRASRTSPRQVSATRRSPWSSPARTSISSTSSKPSPINTVRHCGSRVCVRRVVRSTCGTTSTPPMNSSGSSTTGLSRTVRECSPATRSSTCRPSAAPTVGVACPG